MVRRRPGETDRAYVARLRAIIAADRRPTEVLTADAEADREIQHALWWIQHGASYGYMAGARLDDYRRVEMIARNLGDARRLAVPDVGDRTSAAVAAAVGIAQPWWGRWE